MPPKNDKKPKEDAPSPGLATSTDIFSFIGVLILLGILANSLFLRLEREGGWSGLFEGDFFSELKAFYGGFKFVSGAVIILLGFVIGYFVRNINEIRAKERAELYPKKEDEDQKEKVQVINTRWQRVVDHLESDNMNDWKFAIIEADIILDEMLDAMGYHGDTVGDKLKQVERSDFSSIDFAWEAHKVRNQIAHQGTDFSIDKAEAVRVIELYKRVFEEFYFI